MPNPGLDLERVTPQYMSDLADPLGDVYEAIVNRLLINVARHFAGGVARGRDMIPGSEQWRAWMLARLGALTEENFKIMAEMAGDVSGLTEQALRRAIYDALKLADKELAAKISAPGYVPTVEESAQNALDMYEAQALSRMNLVNTVLLNSSLEAYSKCVNDTTDYARKLEAAQLTLNRRTGEVITGAQSFQQARRRAVLEMADAGLTGFIDRGGHHWSASAYVEMDMRTTALQAAREAVMQRNEEYGNDLIMVSSHPGARPGCEPYQGAIYSTTGRSGTVEDLHGKQLAFTPLSGTSYGEPAGLFGINCGHFSAPFIPGASVMRWPKYDKEESERLYEESQQQRYMERKVRKAKLEAEVLAAAGDEDGAKEQRKKARELNRQLKDWCEDNGRDYYPDRVQIIRTPSGSGNSSNSSNSGN